MSRFNKVTMTKTPGGLRTTNEEGAPAYTLTPEMRFAGILWTSFAKDEFYRSYKDTETVLADLLEKVDIRFAADAAYIARHRVGLRSISHVITALISRDRRATGSDWLRPWCASMIRRPDDMLEILAWLKARGHKPGNALLRGFADKLFSYDEKTLAKWNTGQGLRLWDVANIAHPKSTPALEKLMTNSLPAPRSGETVNWKDPEDVRRAMDEGDLGYLAILYHLRNFCESHKDLLSKALTRLSSPEEIERCSVMPYQYLAAYQATLPLRDLALTNALHFASKRSLANVPVLKNAVVMLDQSTSMCGDPIRNAGMLAATAALASGADLLCFTERAWWVDYDITDNPLNLYQRQLARPDGGTSIPAAFDALEKPYDYVLLFTDEETWYDTGSWGQWGSRTGLEALNEYKARVGADPLVFAMNPATYGTTQFHGPRCFDCRGVSNHVFRLMQWFNEHGKDLPRYCREQVG